MEEEEYEEDKQENETGDTRLKEVRKGERRRNRRE